MTTLEDVTNAIRHSALMMANLSLLTDESAKIKPSRLRLAKRDANIHAKMIGYVVLSAVIADDTKAPKKPAKVAAKATLKAKRVVTVRGKPSKVF